MDKPRIYKYSFGSIYPLYIEKVEKKGRTKREVDAVLRWLTGYSQQQLRTRINNGIDLEAFFQQAPELNPNRHLITGLICGIRVEEIDDPTTQEIRYMDKLIDELAKGKSMEKILRGEDRVAERHERIAKMHVSPEGHGGNGAELVKATRPRRPV